MRVCVADPCRDAFIDTSKKGSRRFCGNRCANRWHVATFRQRKKKDDYAK
ncbi:CGNR zinc finger domain-containing protein [Sinorhizobium sp. 7-81]